MADGGANSNLGGGGADAGNCADFGGEFGAGGFGGAKIGGIGVDIVQISRVAALGERWGEAFWAKFLCAGERAAFVTAQSRAGIWAAKEALAKAFGCGICADFGFLDAEIFRDARGKPRVKFAAAFLQKHAAKGEITAQISISHDGGFAIAFAVTNREI